MAQVDSDKLNAILEPVIEGHGFELVDLSFRREVVGWVLRVFVDRAPLPAGEDPGPMIPTGVSIDDCARLSREMSAVLDVEEPLEQHYTLEVSSPGLDRPLAKARDFARYAGRRAKVRLSEPLPSAPERRNFAGVLQGFAEGAVLIEVDGVRFSLPLASISKANLEYEIETPPKGAAPRSRQSSKPEARPPRPGASDPKQEQ